MDIQRLVEYLDDASQAAAWLESLGLENLQRGHANLVSLADTGMTLDPMLVVAEQLDRHLGRCSDPDMALNNLERFVLALRSALALASLMERDDEAMPTLLQIFSTSQYLSDLLVRDPESFDLLRMTEGQPVARDVLVNEIREEALATGDPRMVTKVLRRYKHRETLRIAYGDIVRGQTVETVTKQISFLADAIVEAAFQAAWKQLELKRGVPRRADGQRSRMAVIALGKLGGVELNYSSDIDLVLLCDGDGRTDGEKSIGNQEFFDRLAGAMVKLLTETTEFGAAYRVDLRLRPDGRQGAAVINLENALRYYDIAGRTWERQAFVKARTIAGDIDLGKQFLTQLEPWIYRRYLSRADITGIKALKRRIEQRSVREGAEEHDVKTGRGGIRDIEFVIQFLQLLNGGELPEVRTGNTLEAIASLEQVGCLTHQERTILEQNYALLRKIEHRLQIMFDLQTHKMPESDREMRRLAMRMGYRDSTDRSALEKFQGDYADNTRLNRQILNHLLHEAFADTEETAPEVDLVLDPEPPTEAIVDVLGQHGFRDVQDAYRNLMALAHEKIPFLSTRRCRHFLASIALRLLSAIAKTPDPDATLVNLSKVSDSLGGKGVLWELFSANEPSLELYVRLCASSPYLSGILTSSPGMIDELMDSLVLDKLPSRSELMETLADLCRGAEDPEPILHSFKNSMHMRVGVRDILGKDDVSQTHQALADIAETTLGEITRQEYQKLAERYGEPTIHGGARDGGLCSLVILALGKLGGREPNYHSDLDVVFLYESQGSTRHQRPTRRAITTNQHFYGQLGQRIIKVITKLGPHGRLYELDPRLRPTGKSGALAVSFAEFERYYAEGSGQLWERQALCKGRTVYGSAEAQESASLLVRNAIIGHPWQPENAEQIRKMRLRMEENATARNLKRGPGGTVDIEFAVQMLQLRSASNNPDVLRSGTLQAIQALHEDAALSADDSAYFSEAYRFLRSVESGLRLMNTAARHDLPTDEIELRKLAFLLRQPDPLALERKCAATTHENRVRFDRLCDDAAAVASP